MASIYNQANLDSKTVAELREMARKLEIPAMSKKRKQVIIDAILAKKAPKAAPRSAPAAPRKTPTQAQTKAAANAVEPCSAPSGHVDKLKGKAVQPPTPVTAAQFSMSSVMTHPSKKKGDKCTTAISVSCGASSGDFPVVGKTVGAVGEFLREALNVSKMAEGLVNGKKVESSQVLCEGDCLEFLKPAGQKG